MISSKKLHCLFYKKQAADTVWFVQCTKLRPWWTETRRCLFHRHCENSQLQQVDLITEQRAGLKPFSLSLCFFEGEEGYDWGLCNRLWVSIFEDGIQGCNSMWMLFVDAKIWNPSLFEGSMLCSFGVLCLISARRPYNGVLLIFLVSRVCLTLLLAHKHRNPASGWHWSSWIFNRRRGQRPGSPCPWTARSL